MKKSSRKARHKKTMGIKNESEAKHVNSLGKNHLNNQQMRYFFICKYNRNSQDYQNEWTTLDELMKNLHASTPPLNYLRLEREFLDVVVQFLRMWDSKPLRYRFCHLYQDGLESSLLDQLIIPFSESVALVQNQRFEDLNFIERLAIFQLAVRGIVVVAIEVPNTEVVFSTVDEGFYWYVALPKDQDVRKLVRSDRLYIYDSINVFSDT